MLCNTVRNYISQAKGLPFFYAVGDSDYMETLNDLKQSGFQVKRVSDFCSKPDKGPDIDVIVDYFHTLDIDCHKNKYILIGLGEYLALRGNDFTKKALSRFKDITLGAARVVLLLRCITPQVRALPEEDNKIVGQQRIYVSENSISSISVICSKYLVNTGMAEGLKGLLHEFEDGATGTCYVNTELKFPNSIIPVSVINSAYETIKQSGINLKVDEKAGSEEQWSYLLQNLQKMNNSLDDLFNRYGFTDNDEENLYANCTGYEFKNWLFFIYLKQNIDSVNNMYLKRIIIDTNNFEDLKDNILTGIIYISRNDNNFTTYYSERKKLIKYFPESDLAGFIRKNNIDPLESIYRLTDCTQVECEEIIKWITKYGYIKEIDTIYPALGEYMKDYIFDCGDISDNLTKYFKQYRIQKVTNHIDNDFMQTVEVNAKNLLYSQLETRDNIIQGIKDKKSTFLYWIDALGVEYLPYITELAHEKGLSLHVDIAYVKLPTITCFNKDFYDNWPGQKQKEQELDDIKHKDKGGFNYEKCKEPIHLVSELKVIKRAIDRAAMELALHSCKAFVIASDHGASRLAVIGSKEEKYEAETQGEHSGRCCKEFQGADIPNAVVENGYLSLADYGRFKGSRAANVEVHGGASLEEVVVPIITLTLRKQSELEIKILKPDSIYPDRHLGTKIDLYISDIENIYNVSIVIEDKKYTAESQDTTHFSVLLPDMKRAKKDVIADVYDGNDLIGTIKFNIKGKMATSNDGFDDFFKEES